MYYFKKPILFLRQIAIKAGDYMPNIPLPLSEQYITTKQLIIVEKS